MNRSGAVAARRVVAVMMALVGALFFYEFLRDDLGSLPDERQQDIQIFLILRYLVAMAIGGAVAGAVIAGLFGRRGGLGWFLAILGALLVTALAGMIGSALALVPDLISDGWVTGDIIPIAFGLVLIPLSLAGRPWLFAIWLALLILTHLWARRCRG